MTDKPPLKHSLPVIREAVQEQLKAECPVAAMLKPKNAIERCHFVGPTKTCDDCTFNWIGLSGVVLEMVREHLKEQQVEKLRGGKSMGKRALIEMAVERGAQASANCSLPADKVRKAASALNELADSLRSNADATFSLFEPFRQALDTMKPPTPDDPDGDGTG